jgi:hypothetical protein
MSFLVKQYETREIDHRLISAEALHEQSVYNERLLNARRKAEKDYFSRTSDYGNIANNIVNLSSGSAEISDSPPKIGILFAPPQVQSSAPEVEMPHNVSFTSASSTGPYSPAVTRHILGRSVDEIHHMSTSPQSLERQYLQQREEEERREQKVQLEREKKQKKERQSSFFSNEEERRNKNIAQEEVSKPNPFQKSSRKSLKQ